MKKRLSILLLFGFSLLIIFAGLTKWNFDIYMESTRLPPKDRVDIKVIIDNQVIFEDTLQQNLAGFPTHNTHPMRIGYHTVSISSEQENICLEKKMFLFFNNYLLLYYSFDERNNKPSFFLDKGKGHFGFE